jgi:foldase protein PrsA
MGFLDSSLWPSYNPFRRMTPVSRRVEPVSSTRLCLAVLASYLLLLLMLGPVLAQETTTTPPPPPAPLAMVNGKPLTIEAFNTAMTDAFARHIFEALLHRRLVFDEAERLGFSLSSEEFAARLKTAKAAYPSEEAFQAALRREGITQDWFIQRLKTDLLLDRIIEHRGALTDEEIAAYYEKYKSQFVRPASVYLWDYATPDLERAYAMAKRLSQGERLSETAEGLTVGWVTRAEIADPLLRDTAFTLEIGQASNPILVAGQYHILYISETQPGLNRSLAQAREEIIAALRKEKGLTRESVLESLVREASVQVNWEPLRYLNGEYLALKQTRILVNGRPVALPRPAYVVGGRMLVPAKAVAEALGAKLSWMAQSSTLIVERGPSKVTFTVGRPIALVGSQPETTAAPRIDEGILMVESRTLVEGLGCTLQWEPLVNTIFIKTPQA